MRPHSKDLRERIIAELEQEEQTQQEIADQFRVSLSFLEKLWRRWQETGNYEALPQGKGPQRALAQAHEIIRAEIAKAPDATLAELCERVHRAGGAKSSPSQMCRELQILNLPLKKSRYTTVKGTRRE